VNFQAYKEVARGILASEAGARLVRLDCMNPVKALAVMRPTFRTSPTRASVRDLEAAWRARWGLTATEGSVRMSTGVRPLLARLFASFARDGRRLRAPEDVYPVYLELAGQAGVALSTFPTVPQPSLPAGEVGRGSEALLLPEPMLPLGRGLNESETAYIRSWLDADRKRLLVLDCVYTFSERFTKTAETLLADGQTVLLHSLAKGFLARDVAGFAIGPRAILEELVHDIGDDSLATAVQLLRDASDLPQRLSTEFSRRWTVLNRTINLPAPATGYFSVVPFAFNELLARGQLAVPGSVFGSRGGDWSAVTCLLADG
jgi:histidinol-phosphate/aromatic aminotransferase/cobyric acid decarboxylase-like protein